MSDGDHPPPYQDSEKAALNSPHDENVDEGLDSSKVKFINVNGGADAHVEIEPESTDSQFCGLTKEELQKYADDPYWVRVRWILLILFWVIWVGMLVAAIIIIVLAPKCPPRPDLEWWQTKSMYQIYPRSFKDSDGNGVGDLKGIEEKLDYLEKLNLTSVWLNPIYESPMVDFGYDISNHTAVDPLFGTTEDFHNLRVAMHKRGMKLIMDFVPNHTSRKHQWFQESIKDATNPYSDYYVWVDGTKGTPPNNWQSVFGGSAWEWEDSRGQYYLHQFKREQPDLNLRNPSVREELKDVLRFWLEKGVDGFRVDAAAHLFESSDMPDESGPGTSYEDLIHTETQFQPETYEIMTEWRKVLDGFNVDNMGKYRMLMVEAYGTPNQTMPFYEWNNTKGADMPFNMNLVELKAGCYSKCVSDLVHNWLNTMPANKWANWVVGNHDKSRVATRMGDDYISAVNMLLMLLPGTPTVYYGDEIGMVDGAITDMKERTPMQWMDTTSCGFSTNATTWLPVNTDCPHKNVKLLQSHGAGSNVLEVLRDLTLLRQQPSFQWGKYSDGQVVNDNLFAFVRQAEGFDGFLVALNFGPKAGVGDFHAARPDIIPRSGTIVGNTGNFDQDRSGDFSIGSTIELDDIHLQPGEGVVFRWDVADIPKVE